MVNVEKKRQATLADVADHAGVSPSTVSYVLSAKRSISEETRERVKRSIEVLGYQPHASARALASNRAGIVALMLPLRADLYLPVMMDIAIAVVTAARRYDYDVLLATNDQVVEAIRRMALGARADGVILTDVGLDDERLPVVRSMGLDAVCLGVPAPSHLDGLTCVDLDFADAGALCVDHLADLGHHQVGFLGPPENVYHRHSGFAERTLAGITARAEQRHLSILHRPCGSSYEDVELAVDTLLHRQPALTGLIVQNEAALGPLLSRLAKLGRRVPDDLSIVAICPDQVAFQSVPALSSVSVPAEDLGHRAIELLMEKLAGTAADNVTLITPTLIPRQSSGPAPDEPQT